MDAKFSEDTQPNEIRPTGKGNLSVPVIKTTRARAHCQQAAATRGHRGRGFPRPPGSRFDVSHRTRQETPSSLSLTRRWGEPSARKRRKVHIDKTFEDGITPSTQGHQAPGAPQREVDVPSDAALEVILIDLPPFCRYGGKGGSKKRRTWINKQLDFLQIDRGLHISESCVVDDTLRVTYFHQTISTNPQTIPSEAELTGSVVFSAGRASSLPRAQIEGHEAILNANNWTDNTQSLPSGNIAQSMFSVQSPSCYGVLSDALRSEIPANSQRPGYSCSSFRSGTLVITANYLATRPHQRPHEQITQLGARPGCIEPSSVDFMLPSASDPHYPDVQDGTSCITQDPLVSPPTLPNIPQNDDITENQCHTPDIHSFLVEEPNEVVTVVRDKNDKPRRLLSAKGHGLISITMRGTINCMGKGFPRRGFLLLPGKESGGPLVTDSCVLEDVDSSYLVLGYQASRGSISMIDLSEKRIKVLDSFDPPAVGDESKGVSALAALHAPRMLASGGYNHSVHLWRIPQGRGLASCQSLAIEHRSQVQSLLSIRDSSDKLVSAGADCSVNLWDLSSERTISTFKTSNSVYHVHRTPLPFCILLEVANRELQFEVRDFRLTPERAVQRFGYLTKNLQGRYHGKGDVHSSVFASGDRDGVVRFWDMRQVKEPFKEFVCFPGRSILHVLFDKEEVAACSEDYHIAFMKYNAECADIASPIDF